MTSSGEASYPPLSQSKNPFVEEDDEVIAVDGGGGDRKMLDGGLDPGQQADGNTKNSEDGNDGPWAQKRYNKAKEIKALAEDDYYGILGLRKSCKTDEIKQQFKTLAQMTHPDKSKWPDSKMAFQRVSIAYSVLKDPQERSSYDKKQKKKGKYIAPPVDAERQFGEEFDPGAFGSDSGSEDGAGDGSDDERQENLRPNQAHKAIYKEATPFVQKLLTDPPMTKADKKESKKVVTAFNQRIKAQNIADGLKGADQSKFYIQYSIFESNSLLAKPYLDKLKDTPQDLGAEKRVGYFDGILKAAVRDNEYNEEWYYYPNNQGDDHPMDGIENNEHGGGSRPTKPTKKSASSTQEETLVKWKPGYTLTGEKIMAVLPQERTIHRMNKSIRGPAEKIVSYQFIVKDEEEDLIELMSGADVGQRATNGYLSLPEDQIFDARYSEKRYTREDAGSFEKLIDWTANPFQVQTLGSSRHPNGYGLVLKKDGSQDIVSRTALRKWLGLNDADWEVQECEKRKGRTPAYKIPPLGWREPKSKTIESPTNRRLSRQARVTGSAEGLFVQDRAFGQRNTNRRGRSISKSSSHSTKNGGRSMPRSSVNAGEIADIKGDVAELKKMLAALTLTLKEK